MANLPTTIKAVYQPDPSSQSLLQTTTPIPTPKDPRDYLIQVKATSPCLNELTWEVNFASLFPPDRERVPCTECAGVVSTAPANGKFKVGDEVFFRRDAWSTGCLREYTLARDEEMALKPKSLSWAEAAVTPLSSLTAWQGLFVQGTLDPAAIHGDKAALEKNRKVRVLITGAGGGVGGWAVQFAREAGAGAIIAVCGPSKAAIAKAFGATEVVDYRATPINEWAAAEPAHRECDLILDCVGGSSLVNLWTALQHGGTFLSVAGAPDQVKPEGETKSAAEAKWFLVRPIGSNLEEIAALIDAGKCKPEIDSVYEFEDFAKAFEKVEHGKPAGKVVINVSA
ncbi:Fc.00g002340.m01.CDS01 [Cosmosporella sp. VM-42]